MAPDKTAELTRVTPVANDGANQSAGTAFWKVLTRFDHAKLNPYQAIRNAAGVSIPLIIGYALGMPRGGLVVASGALNVSYSDGSDPYAQRAKRMLSSSVLCAVAVLVGSLSGKQFVANTLIELVWAFLVGMCVAFGGAAPDIGVISLVTMLIYSAQTLTTRQAVVSTGLALAGGLLQTLLSVALWPVRRYEPERRALTHFYLELARATGEPLTATASPPSSTVSTQAQEALAGIARDTSLEALRYRAMLNQAERIRLALLMLSRLRVRMEREKPGHHLIALLDEYLERISDALRWIGNSLQSGKLEGVSQQNLSALAELRGRFRQEANEQGGSFFAAAAGDVRFQLDALGGQVRAAIELAANASSTGATAFAKKDAKMPWRLKFGGWLATFGANLNFQSSALRHAVRLAALVAIANMLEHSFSWRRSYWLPMTIVLVLKPEFSVTFSRGLLRIAGTSAGLLLATALFHFVPSSVVWQIAWIFIFTLLLRWLGPANYGVFGVFVSALIVMLIAITGVAPKDVILARGMNTAAGGALALLAYWLWPTWERARISERVAQLLDAYRQYFASLSGAYQRQEGTSDRELDRQRLSARMARSNLEAAIDRLATEPGTDPAHMGTLNAILASTHRFVHAAMALDAGWSQTPAVPPRREFTIFSDAINTTFLLLSRVLRGEKVRQSEYPDLREAFTQLQKAGDPSVQRYALVNIEADRITNSLDTLREHIESGLSASPESSAAELLKPRDL